MQLKWPTQLVVLPIGNSTVYERVPKEEASSVWFGIAVHVGPLVISYLLFSWLGPSLSMMFLATLPVSFLALGIAELAAWMRPGVALPPMTLGSFIRGFLWNIVGKGLVIGDLSVLVLHTIFHSIFSIVSRPAGFFSVLVAVAFSDFWYYSLHRWILHGRGADALSKWGRKEHAVHHSVTELDFWRGNRGSIFDNGFMSFPLPLALISVPLGMDISTTIFVYMLLMTIQITHHVNHSFDIGLLRYLILDSHTHKLHHCIKGRLVNFAAVFSVWDRLFGSYYEEPRLSPGYLHAHKIPLPIAQERREFPQVQVSS